MTPRLQRHPLLALFDGPDTNTTTGRRTSAIVPAQALYLMNSMEVKDCAEALAARVLQQPEPERVATAYRLVFQREPQGADSERAARFLREASAHADPLALWTSVCRSLVISNEFFYVD